MPARKAKGDDPACPAWPSFCHVFASDWRWDCGEPHPTIPRPPDCRSGGIGLALDGVASWIDYLELGDRAHRHHDPNWKDAA